jgi:hypothetical protein
VEVRVGFEIGSLLVMASSFRIPQVGEYKSMSGIGDFVEGLTGVDRFRYGVSGILEGQSQDATEAVFIFDE